MRQDSLVVLLLGAMIAGSLFAVGGVYVWAGASLMAAAALLAVVARPVPGTPSDTRMLDGWLIVSTVVAAIPLIPLPQSMRAVLSPHADEIRSALYLVPPDATAWQPLSIAPRATAYALGLVLAVLVVFWAARQACARGRARRLIRICAFAGLGAAFIAIALQAVADRSLIYGVWRPIDEGARPFGPFVNRNHFATWMVMACPLAAGYVIAALGPRKPASSLAAKFVTMFEWLGTTTAWVLAAGVVMTIALLVSVSRSGVVAFAVSFAAGAWLARARATRRAKILTVAAVLALAAIVAAYVNMQPLISRVDETLAVGAGGRPRIWQETRRVIGDFWLTGTGLGGYQTAMVVTQQGDRSHFINQAHNQYLQILAEGGVLLAVPVLMVVVAFIRLVRLRLAEDTTSSVWLRMGGAIAILAVAVQSIWETGLRMPANGVLFAIAAAVAVHQRSLAEARRA